VAVEAYSSADAVKCSDHRPVFAHFLVKLRPGPALPNQLAAPSSRTCAVS
jgi:hypothetical protein